MPELAKLRVVVTIAVGGALAALAMTGCSVDQQTINDAVEEGLAEKKTEAGVYDESNPPPEDIIIAGHQPAVTITKDGSGDYTLRTPGRIFNRGDDLHVYNALTTPCKVFPDNGESGKNVGVGEWVKFEGDSAAADPVILFEVRCGSWKDKVGFEIKG